MGRGLWKWRMWGGGSEEGEEGRRRWRGGGRREGVEEEVRKRGGRGGGRGDKIGKSLAIITHQSITITATHCYSEKLYNGHV